jgi:hypothetical protein
VLFRWSQCRIFGLVVRHFEKSWNLEIECEMTSFSKIKLIPMTWFISQMSTWFHYLFLKCAILRIAWATIIEQSESPRFKPFCSRMRDKSAIFRLFVIIFPIVLCNLFQLLNSLLIDWNENFLSDRPEYFTHLCDRFVCWLSDSSKIFSLCIAKEENVRRCHIRVIKRTCNPSSFYVFENSIR